MEKNILLRKSLFLLVLVALIFPVFFISLQAPLLSFEWDPLLAKIGLGAIKQAILSTLLTMILGGLATLGLLSIAGGMPSKKMQFLQFALILPGFVPPLLVVTLSVRVMNYLPTGLWAVVFFHVLMNVGLVTVILYHLIRERASEWLEFSQVAGVPKGRRLFYGILK